MPQSEIQDSDRRSHGYRPCLRHVNFLLFSFLVARYLYILFASVSDRNASLLTTTAAPELHFDTNQLVKSTRDLLPVFFNRPDFQYPLLFTRAGIKVDLSRDSVGEINNRHYKLMQLIETIKTLFKQHPVDENSSNEFQQYVVSHPAAYRYLLRHHGSLEELFNLSELRATLFNQYFRQFSCRYSPIITEAFENRGDFLASQLQP